MAHIFINKMKQYPELMEELLSAPTLRKFMKALDKISATDEAIFTWEAGSYAKFEDEDAKSWTCFGFGTEMLVEFYLKMFGPAEHNIIFDRSVEDEDSTEGDKGIDHFGFTNKKTTVKKVKRICKSGAPVYIQTKGTLNHSKEHMTNDGSRILNFLATAQVDALQKGMSYGARYVVVTTAKGLHWKMEQNTAGIMEVIGYKKLSKMIDNNWYFWNQIRREFGLTDIAPVLPVDAEFKDVERQIEVDS